MNISVAAFIMSLAATVTTLYYALRGSEIAVQPPQQVLLYRDGTDAGAVLTIGLRVDAINLADGYGDVLTEAKVELPQLGTRHPHQGMITTVFADRRKGEVECDLAARCLNLNGLSVVERSDQLLDFPAGAAKPINLSYPVTGWNCDGTKAGCESLGDFAAVARRLNGRPLELKITLKFQSDGTKTLRCRTGSVDAAYLAKIGWVSLSCVSAA